jgi:hypothetical protein
MTTVVVSFRNDSTCQRYRTDRSGTRTSSFGVDRSKEAPALKLMIQLDYANQPTNKTKIIG